MAWAWHVRHADGCDSQLGDVDSTSQSLAAVPAASSGLHQLLLTTRAPTKDAQEIKLII